jgi:hypothetical protein
VLRLSAFLFAVAPVLAFAQTPCPGVNFLTARTVNLKPTDTSHIDVVRQNDGSYTGFEVSDAAPFRLIATTPHFEKQFAACLPHTIPASPTAPAPVANPTGAGSQLPVSMTLASGSLFVANISSDGQTIYFDLFDSAHNLLSQSSVAPPLPPNQGIASLALADVNRDGKLDLIAVFAAGVWVATGNGDGTFQPGKSSTLPGSSSVPSSYAVALGDLNGDGVPDLVLSAASGGPFTIALGKGDGTFTERGSLSVPAFGLHSTTAAIADLNGDGKADLVLSGAGELIAVALGNGDGTFQAISLYSALNSSSGFSLASVAVGAVNGDGIPDIVTNGSILFGDGKGGFPSRRDYTSVAGGSVMLADFDGDGITDIIIGNGNPDFLSGAALNPSSSIGLQLCDYMNLSYFCPVEYSLAVLFGAGGGAFVAAPAVEVVDSGYYPSLASADFNGDGIPDLAVATFAVTTSANSISILEGKGNGEFSSGFTQSLGPSPVISPVAVAAADFNHDGRPDVAVLVALGASSEVQVFPGNGDGTLGAPVTVSIADIFVNSVAAPDVNGDGIPDLVVTSDIAVYVSLNKGDGTFSAPVMVSSIRSAIVGFGDFNGDGKLDIAVSASQTDNLVVLLGKGDGTFPNSVQSTLPFSEPAALAVADFNGDGKLDLALTFYGTIAVMFGQGNGGFSGYQLSPSGGGGLDPISRRT